MPREERHSRQRPALVEIRKFKGSTVYEWDAEPAEERASEFSDSSQLNSTWGPTSKSAYVMLETRRSRPKTPRRGNSGALWLALALVIAIGAAGLGLLKLFHP